MLNVAHRGKGKDSHFQQDFQQANTLSAFEWVRKAFEGRAYMVQKKSETKHQLV